MDNQSSNFDSEMNHEGHSRKPRHTRAGEIWTSLARIAKSGSCSQNLCWMIIISDICITCYHKGVLQPGLRALKRPSNTARLSRILIFTTIGLSICSSFFLPLPSKGGPGSKVNDWLSEFKESGVSSWSLKGGRLIAQHVNLYHSCSSLTDFFCFPSIL